MQTRHLDGNPRNNHLWNLCYGTPSENAADKEHHGRALIGEKSPRRKLHEAQVLAIRRRWGAGENAWAIAPSFGVSPYTVWAVAVGRAWKHLPEIQPRRYARLA
jgi:hypothetical protein